VGGARWADQRGRRAGQQEGPSPAAGVTGPLARRLQRQAGPARRAGVPANGVPPSGPPGSDWRGGRAGPTTSGFQVFSGPAPGVAVGRGDDLTGAQKAKRSAVRAAPASSSAGLVHAQREGARGRAPRPREGLLSISRRHDLPSRMTQSAVLLKPATVNCASDPDPRSSPPLFPVSATRPSASSPLQVTL